MTCLPGVNWSTAELPLARGAGPVYHRFPAWPAQPSRPAAV